MGALFEFHTSRQEKAEEEINEQAAPSSAPEAHMVTENSPSSVLIETRFCCHDPTPALAAPPPEAQIASPEAAVPEAKAGAKDRGDDDI